MASNKKEPKKELLNPSSNLLDVMLTNLHDRDQKVLVRIILLLEAGDEAEDGAEHHHDAAG